MIHDLDVAISLHALHRIREFVVTQEVFLKVLQKCRRRGRRERVQINSRHDSLAYRFVNQATWQGILFIHLSNETLMVEQETPSA